MKCCVSVAYMQIQIGIAFEACQVKVKGTVTTLTVTVTWSDSEQYRLHRCWIHAGCKLFSWRCAIGNSYILESLQELCKKFAVSLQVLCFARRLQQLCKNFARRTLQEVCSKFASTLQEDKFLQSKLFAANLLQTFTMQIRFAAFK